MPKTKHPLMKEIERMHKKANTIGSEVSLLVAKLQREYKKLDPKTKQKIAAGLAGIGVALAAARIYRKHTRKRTN